MNEKPTNDQSDTTHVLFVLGPIRVSTMASRKVTDHEIEEAIARHERGDFGRVGLPARIVYHGVLQTGRGSIMSIYDAACAVEFAIVTDFNTGRTEISLMDEIMAGIPKL